MDGYFFFLWRMYTTMDMLLKRKRLFAIKDVVTFWAFLYTTYFTLDAKAPYYRGLFPDKSVTPGASTSAHTRILWSCPHCCPQLA
jgi:hypothetical protein